MSLAKFLSKLVNLLCGGSDPAPGGGQTQPPHAPPPGQHQPQEYPPSHKPPQKPHSPPHKPEHPGQHYSDPNQVNQHDAHYMRLRAQANEEGDAMAKCFSESHSAYERGDGAGAKQLSNDGKEHQRKMNDLNKEASNWIYIENNKDSKAGEIDLHGLYVKEAIEHTDQAIQEAKQRGDSELHLIVGKGLHSPGGAGKLKPAIEELHELSAELDPHNAGVLVVQIGGRQGGVGADEIARRLDREQEGCTIM
ncbi:cytoplasmic protein [Mycena belliarum]|uniref:Cytoplasmic protein n=1 Tax=Mycena belliarum TaxID=1033014 RepID=A0AAD6TZ12_9AGAR|nr:cytoplasmic protein [Mycena belliae]